MSLENIVEILQTNIKKINSAISDIDYASSYSRSSASSSYCGYAKSSLREVINELMTITPKSNNISEILQNNIGKINNAISNADYASSYSRSSASSSYCSYAKSSLRSVQEEFKQIISNLDKSKSQSNEEDLERSL